MHWRFGECGLILSATSQWDHWQRSGKNSSKNAWGCSYCRGHWASKRGGGRFVQLYAQGLVIQLILDNPPQALWNKWCRERCEYYKRMEPVDTVRDVPPMKPSGARHVFRAEGPLSDTIWQTLLINPGLEERKQLAILAEQFQEKQSKATLQHARAPTKVMDMTVEV